MFEKNPVTKTGSTVEDCFMFGFIIPSCDDGEMSYGFAKNARYKSDLNREVKEFITGMDTFWLDYGDLRYKLIGWHDGIPRFNHAVVLDEGIAEMIDEMEDKINSATRYANFDIPLYELSFRQIVLIYRELSDLDEVWLFTHGVLFMTIRVAMYQYLRCVPWWTRKKALKILDSEEFTQLSYTNMWSDFTWAVANDWKVKTHV